MITALMPAARPQAPTRTRPAAHLHPFPSEGGVQPQHAALAAFPAEARWLGAMRSFASGVLGRWPVPEETREAAMIVLGEFTANAVVHGRSELSVLMTLSDGHVTLNVRDGGALHSTGDEPHPADDEHGRGLLMVDALAERWEAVRAPLGWRCTARLRAFDTG